MFRNVLVHIPTERSARPAVDCSISFAMGTGAHLDAIAIGYEASNIPFAAEGGAAVVSIYEVEHERALERAESALSIFDTAARNADISYATRAVSAIPADAAAIIGASGQGASATKPATSAGSRPGGCVPSRTTCDVPDLLSALPESRASKLSGRHSRELLANSSAPFPYRQQWNGRAGGRDSRCDRQSSAKARRRHCRSAGRVTCRG